VFKVSSIVRSYSGQPKAAPVSVELKHGQVPSKADCSRITGKPKTIDSSVGLVPNALVLTALTNFRMAIRNL
jgi:hypothetical protein